MPDDNNNLPTQQDPTRPVLTTEEVPTANPPTQDPSQPAVPSNPPTPNTPGDNQPLVVPETLDVPPPPAEATTTTPTEGSSAPSFDLPPVVGAPPRKKFGGKKVISTILGLLLLVGGIGVGVSLVRQQQDIREQAKGATCNGSSAGRCAGQPAGTKCGDGVCTLKGDGSCSCNTKASVCNAQGASGCAGRKPGDSCSGGVCGSIRSDGGCACVSNTGTETGSTSTGGGGTEGAFCNLTTGKKCASGFKCVETPGAGGDGTCESTGGGGNFICSGSCEVSQTICKNKGGTPTGNNGNLADNGDCGAGQICCVGGGTSSGGNTSGGGGGTGGGSKSANECSNASAAQCDQGVKINDTCHQGRGTCIDTGKKGGDGQPVCRCKVPDDTCKEACPIADGTRLLNCTPPEADGTPEESICSKVGRVESCGGKSYCCPVAGGKWTTDMSACQGSGQCLNVKAYSADGNFTQLTADQLKGLKEGDKVRFAIAGSVTSGTSGNYDKAKFKINGDDKGEVTQQKPGSNEFWYEYTIPSGTTSFNITAQIHHTVLGWSN